MPKLAILSGGAVIGILEKHGFFRVRQKGSHVTMQRVINGIEFNVVVPLHTDLAKGTLVSIIRQSGLNREYFCK